MPYDFPNNPTTGQTLTMASGARYRYDGTKWAAASPAGPVTSFNTRTGAVVLGTTDVTAALGYTAYNASNPNGYQSAAQVTTALGAYVPLIGATLTGPLALAADPVAAAEAATRRYVDNAVATATPAGLPLVLTSAGAVTLTGIVAETNMLALRIPANSMGRNGVVEVKGLFSHTNSAGAKTLQLRWNATSGATSGNPVGGAISVTTTADSQGMWMIRSNNATNAQQAYAGAPTAPFGTVAAAVFAFSIDTTADSYLNFNGTVAAAGDTLTLAHVYAVVFPHS
jgi:hypothetical protein